MLKNNLKPKELKNINFNFGNRKIVKVRFTHYLAIPSIWIKNMKLSKGDSLNIEMIAGNSLRITVPYARQDTENRELTPKYVRCQH